MCAAQAGDAEDQQGERADARFFLIIEGVRKATRGFEVVKLKGFVRDDKIVNVHLINGKTIDGLRFVGCTSESDGKVPYPLQRLLVLETAREERVLLRADRVVIIEEVSGLARL